MIVETLLNPWRPEEGPVSLSLNEALFHWRTNFNTAHRLAFEMERALCDLHALALPGEPYRDWRESVKRIKEVLEERK